MKKIVALVLAVVVFGLVCLMLPNHDMLQDIYAVLEKETDARGDNVRIVVIDSGVNSNLLLTDSSINFSKDGTADDIVDHGTPVFNIIKKLAPNAEIFSLKVVNKSGIVSMNALVRALEWCMENNIDIINMSLSFSMYDENVENLCAVLIDSGVIIVSSISNEKSLVDYPSMYKGVIAVGYTENYNLYTNDTSVIFNIPHSVKTINNNGSLVEYKGNSILAPIVTGILADILSDENNQYRKGDSNVELVREVKDFLDRSNIHAVK